MKKKQEQEEELMPFPLMIFLAFVLLVVIVGSLLSYATFFKGSDGQWECIEWHTKHEKKIIDYYICEDECLEFRDGGYHGLCISTCELDNMNRYMDSLYTNTTYPYIYEYETEVCIKEGLVREVIV